MTIINEFVGYTIHARYAVKSLSAIQIKYQQDAVSKEPKQTPFKGLFQIRKRIKIN